MDWEKLTRLWPFGVRGEIEDLAEEEGEALEREDVIFQTAMQLLERSRYEGCGGVLNGWFTTETWKEAARRARVVADSGVEVLTARDFIKAYERYKGEQEGD